MRYTVYRFYTVFDADSLRVGFGDSRDQNVSNNRDSGTWLLLFQNNFIALVS